MPHYQLAILGALLAGLALVLRNLRDYRRPEQTAHTNLAPTDFISVLIPARNEAANIERCLDGLLTQDYPAFEILVLDDGSTDDTAARVRRLAESHPRLRLLSGASLLPGWAGKAYACRQLSEAARGDWLLFLDADTLRHAPGLLRATLSEARRTGADLLSTFPHQQIQSLGEALTVPMIYWVLFTMLPIGRVSRDPNPALCAACGQFLFANREAYFQTGGHSANPASLHDGLHLARRFKRCGKRVALTDLSALVECRMYHGWRQCWRGFTRNAYQGIGSLPALLAVTFLQGILCLAPFVFLGASLAAPWSPWGGVTLLQVAVLLAVGAALRRRFRFPGITVALLPLAVAALIAIQWGSWWSTVRKLPTDWKGRRTAGLTSGP